MLRYFETIIENTSGYFWLYFGRCTVREKCAKQLWNLCERHCVQYCHASALQNTRMLL